MNQQPNLDELVDNVQEYVETRATIAKLQLIEKGSQMSGAMVANLTFIFLLLTVLALFSIAASVAISDWLGHKYLGFLIIGGVYLIACILLYFNQEKWIRKPVSDNIIKSTLKDYEHE